MLTQEYRFAFEEYNSLDELPQQDADLLGKARAIAESAYAPYSRFHVGAAALTAGGQIVTGTNQENASYPVGICAERSLLATAATLFPDVPLITLAVSYHNFNGASDTPITPCGICRQTLAEYEQRTHHGIRLVLGGLEGKVYVIPRAGLLLPLGFSSDDMK